MDVPFATNFNDYVALMSVNLPHALVMDWWRRLDLTLHEYAAALGTVVTRNRPIEEAVQKLARIDWCGPGNWQRTRASS